MHHSGSDLVFDARTGCATGVETHSFRAETDGELSRWVRALVQGSHNAAALTKEIDCSKRIGKSLYCCSSMLLRTIPSPWQKSSQSIHVVNELPVLLYSIYHVIFRVKNNP